MSDLSQPAADGVGTPGVVPSNRIALTVACIAACFCMIIASTLIFQHATATTNDPWKSPQLLDLKAQLAASPKDEAIKARIRDLDLKYRRRFFRRLELDRTGGWLLAGGLAVLIAAARRASARPVPIPERDSNTTHRALAQAANARGAVGAVGGVVLAAFIVLALQRAPVVPSTLAELQKAAAPGAAAAPQSDLPPAAEFLANWPRFRGPEGSGACKSNDFPASWDGKSGSGVLWKTPVPAPGFNSPIVWGNRIFLSGGGAEKREVFCFDSAKGELVWRRAVENVPGSPAKVPEIPEQTGYAASTMATDGRRVYVIFATGDLAAFTCDGNPVWSKHLGTPKNQYGHATSLAIWQGRVLVQLDQGESGPANSRLIAFDGASGRVVWEKSRPVQASWATPIVYEAAGKTQVLTLGLPWVIAYSLADGAELWKAKLLDGEITPSPVFANGLACATSPSSKLFGIKADGSGDVTQSHVVWTSEDSIPDVTSPATNGELVFYVSGAGQLTCIDAKDGKKQWDHDFSFEVQASPSIAGNRVYLIGANGTAAVVEAGRQFKQLGKGALEDKFYASPAFVAGHIYLRGVTNLWCLGAGHNP